ncbi:unnamed protein product [Moneuplotes crassus]|uniref:Uncharacterized protein n=1 Tax=Euplotes crassus TaxID=5936 RepID=A0AAD2CYW1_EUPCR|nr:unnamed protein product [Moneuplotes crassus]
MKNQKLVFNPYKNTPNCLKPALKRSHSVSCRNIREYSKSQKVLRFNLPYEDSEDDFSTKTSETSYEKGYRRSMKKAIHRTNSSVKRYISSRRSYLGSLKLLSRSNQVPKHYNHIKKLKKQAGCAETNRSLGILDTQKSDQKRECRVQSSNKEIRIDLSIPAIRYIDSDKSKQENQVSSKKKSTSVRNLTQTALSSDLEKQEEDKMRARPKKLAVKQITVIPHGKLLKNRMFASDKKVSKMKQFRIGCRQIKIARRFDTKLEAQSGEKTRNVEYQDPAFSQGRPQSYYKKFKSSFKKKKVSCLQALKYNLLFI